MGLAISTHLLADLRHGDPEGEAWIRGMLQGVQEVLAENGLPTWEEPEDFPREGTPRVRAHVGSFPYSYLHYLRRAYALLRERPGQPLTPTEELTDADDLIIADASTLFDSHLLCHSDAEGLYVPVDIGDPLFELDTPRVPGGGMLGSCVGLLRELRLVAPALGISLDADGQLSDQEAQALARVEDSDPFRREKIVFLALWENARVSLAHHSALIFH